MTEAACWSHGRRKFFVPADVTAKPRGKLPVLQPYMTGGIKLEVKSEMADPPIRERQRLSPRSGLKPWLSSEGLN
jgi:hypothetical protein